MTVKVSIRLVLIIPPCLKQPSAGKNSVTAKTAAAGINKITTKTGF